MENESRRGRPSKAEGIAKREHFSVWVNADQKKQITELIEKSGLSASQFFVTLALDIPYKRPQKKTLPKQTADTIRILEQLSGVLSLAVLKTKDAGMLSVNWQRSSQQVRALAKLISLWVFENFEIRSLEDTLSSVIRSMQKLQDYLQFVLPDGKSKKQVISEIKSIQEKVKFLLDKHQAYYQDVAPQISRVWKTSESQAESDVHVAILRALETAIRLTKI